MSAVKKLEEAEVIDPSVLTAKHLKVIDNLSAEEIEALIAIKNKLGASPPWKPRSSVRKGHVLAL
ncbi:MAG: hypothetical protein OXU20_19865 [Myxococcales bacterium]|nr:hypothetical protein [Myxococcales bacterium]